MDNTELPMIIDGLYTTKEEHGQEEKIWKLKSIGKYFVQLNPFKDDSDIYCIRIPVEDFNRHYKIY